MSDGGRSAVNIRLIPAGKEVITDKIVTTNKVLASFLSRSTMERHAVLGKRLRLVEIQIARYAPVMTTTDIIIITATTYLYSLLPFVSNTPNCTVIVAFMDAMSQTIPTETW